MPLVVIDSLAIHIKLALWSFGDYKSVNGGLLGLVHCLDWTAWTGFSPIYKDQLPLYLCQQNS